MTPYNAIANAIVIQAVSDYRDSLRGKRADRYVSVKDMLKDCERFFESEWFTTLTKIDGKRLMRELQEEYKNGSKPCTKYKKPNRNYL